MNKSQPETHTVRVCDIVEDERLQVRVSIDPSVVNDYAAAYGRNDDMPDIVCFEIDGRLYVVSGFTRLAGMKKQGIEERDVIVMAGTFKEALRYALGANRTNAARLTRNDKRKAATTHILNFPEDSDRVIARSIGCSPTTIGNIRKELGAGVQIGHVTERKGADGKTYSVTPKCKHPIPLHEAATLFPMVVGRKYEYIKSSINKRGLNDSIALYDGKILDGKIRYRACLELGIEPHFHEVSTDVDPFDYVWGMNGCRKSLTPEESQDLHEKMMESLSDEGKANLEPWEREPPSDEPDELDWDVEAYFA